LDQAYEVLLYGKLLSSQQIIDRLQVRSPSKPSVREMSQAMRTDHRFVPIKPIGESITLWKPRRV
jgi:hypothetical protein